MLKLKRRDFIKLVGSGGVGAGLGLLFGEQTQKAVEFLVPQPLMPEEYSPGLSTWYNTTCRQCGAGCGVMVRNFEGRAKKIEGNPSHPVNQGRLCARGQAGLNVLYHPDRLRGPMIRSGERGDGSFRDVGWSEALDRVAPRLAELGANGDGASVWLLSNPVRGHLDELLAEFMQALGSGHYYHHELDYPASLYEANRRSFGIRRLPYYDIAETDFLLSFGADPVGTWLSPVHYGLAYGRMRRGRPGRRGHYAQVEPRMSLSGGNADEWIPAAPGTEGLLALAMAQHIVASGGYAGADADDWRRRLAGFAPDAVAGRADVDAQRIRSLAERFAGAQRSLAIGGGPAAHSLNGVANLTAINVLNHLAGRVGRPGGVLFNPDPVFGNAGMDRFASQARIETLVREARAGRVQALLLHDTDPVHSLPGASGLREALEQIPLVVAVGCFVNDTVSHADVVLPTHSYLETWGDDVPEPGMGFPVATIAQPVVKPLYDTLPAGEVFMRLAEEIGAPFPDDDMQAYLRRKWRAIHEAHGQGGDFEAFWREVRQAGVWGLSSAPSKVQANTPTPAVLDGLDFDEAAPAGAGEYSFQPYTTVMFGDGRDANLPWMQELPEPFTGNVFATWIELNPQTARELNLRDGDVVEVTSGHGSLQAPVLSHPGVRPDVVGMPIGQGHGNYTRFGTGHGVNPISIVAPVATPESGALAWAGNRVTLRRTGKRKPLISASGKPRDLGRQILG